MEKVALVAFNGEAMCFVHVLLNGLDMAGQGLDVRLIIEGAAVKLIPELAKPENEFHRLWTKTLEKGLLDAVCRACSNKMGVLDRVQELNLPLAGEMSGHPSLGRYLAAGYKIITF